MQHHGAPTRLLDLDGVAVRRRVFRHPAGWVGHDGAVWCFCHRRLHNAFVKDYGAEPPDLTKTEDEDPEREATAQALRNPEAPPSVVPLAFSSFQAHGWRNSRDDSRCAWSESGGRLHRGESTATHLKKIIIPHRIKPDFLAELRRMNITAAALFPGVDGLGKSIAELTSLGAQHAAAARKA